MIKPGNPEIKPNSVLICPLDWGLGHASRLIPVVNDFLNSGCKVILGGSGKSGELLHLSFPSLLFVTIPCYSIRYPAKGFWLLPSLIIQLPLLLYSAVREHYILGKLVKEFKIDLVISDNRYGLFSKQTKSIFITHQISPRLPRYLKFAEYPLYMLIRKIINRFDECWIPDYQEENNLTGLLSRRFPLPSHARYIGLLSRFSNSESPLNSEDLKYDIVVVLSGPQPGLRKFTEKVVKQASRLPLKILIITGFQEEVNTISRNQLDVKSHLPVSHFKNVLLNAGTIICRSGYSSIMDLMILGISHKAVLIPTPGQTEQEYLAEFLSKKGIFRTRKETELDLQELTISVQK